MNADRLQRLRRFGRLAIALVVLQGATVPATASSSEVSSSEASSETAASHQLDAVNGTFTDLDLSLVPIEQGGFEVVASSPEHELRILENRLTLTPTDALEAVPGALTASFEALVEGEGRLILELQGLGDGSRIDDRVEIGRQRISVTAVVLLQTKPFGYQLDVIEPLQRTVNVLVQSDAADQIVSTCRTFGGFLLINCDGLQASLRLARVPMPEAGSRFLLDPELLSAADRAFLDAHALDGPDPFAGADSTQSPADGGG